MAVEENNEIKKQKLFTNIKYKITGKVDEEVERILQNGGAEVFSYFSDYVTHCIVGVDPVDTDISDANDLYEVPAVSQDWVIYSLKCNKLLPTSAFKGGEKLLFTGVIASFSKLSQDDSKKLWAMLKFYGGSYSSTFTKTTTHLIVSKPEGQKYEQALKCSDIIHVVTPDWLVDSVRTNSLCAEILYHPRLLIIEKPQVKSDYQSTAYITGFADDVVPDESSSGIVPSSEILQQLKLRMPWNQPSQSVSSASSTQGPIVSGTPTIQKQVFSGPQMSLPHPRSVSSILQSSRPSTPQPPPQQQLLQQRALQQQRLLQQPNMQQWRPQTQLQQQHQSLGQKPGLQLAVLQQQIHQQPIQQQAVHQQTVQQPQHLQQHLALTQQKTLLQQQTPQQHFIVHDNQQQTGASQQQQQIVPQMVQHQVVQQQQSFVTLANNNNQLNWNQQQQQQQQHHQQQQFQIRQQQLQQLQQQQQQQTALPSQQQPQIQQRQITWTQQTQQQGPPRQLIHMDAATHAQLQQMDPQQRAMFLHNIQKQRQIALQRQMQQQQQQRQAVQQQQQQQNVGVGAGSSTVVVSGGLRQQSVAVIRGHIPSGLNPQQQLQWLQQQRHQQQIVIQQNTQLRQQVLVQQQQQQPERQIPPQQLITNNSPTVLNQPQQPVLQTPSWPPQPSDAQLQGQAGTQQQQQQMVQLRQQHLQLHQFQQLQQKQQQVSTAGVRLTHPNTPQPMLYNNQMPPQNAVSANQSSLPHQPLTEPVDSVASSTDLFSITNSVEGSAAGQLRLMTAQHHVQQLQPPPPNPASTPSPVITAPMRGSVQQNRVGATLKTDCGREVTPPSVMGPVTKPPYTQTAARVAAVLAKSAAASQPPQSHQRPQFFGHNPNLKLPTDMFLFGCIILIVEYDRTGDNISEWTRCITEYGGEVESTYTLRVTHIICQTQKHPLVQQGIRDAKRCVTAEWLSDVCLKQQVLPPWLALHYPTPYSEEKPCRNLIISYSGFEGEERSKVKKMIEATGAKITSYFSSHNNILVCRRPDGEKYKRAREWGKSVVNVQWLTEILFGHYSCLQQPDSHKYQQYNLGNPFRIDYILVPHLMAAWKAPINVTQDSYERLKSNPPFSARRKRPRISYSNQYLENNENENKNCMMEGVEIINPNPPTPEKRPCILFSGSYGESQKEDAKKVVMLGGTLAITASEATHLVVNGGVTLKLYCCITTCKHIVTTQWIADSFARSHFLDESSYIYCNPELEKQYNFKLSLTLTMPNRRNLFKNKKFYLSPSVVPGRMALTEMIVYAGGSVDRQRRSLRFMQDQGPLGYFVITVPKDYHLVADVLRSSLGVYSSEFILTCILRQSIEHEAATMVIMKKNLNKGR